MSYSYEQKVVCEVGWLSFLVYARLEQRLNECFAEGWTLDSRAICSDQGYLKSKFIVLLTRQKVTSNGN